jgi:predicted transcriptional regulator
MHSIIPKKVRVLKRDPEIEYLALEKGLPAAAIGEIIGKSQSRVVNYLISRNIHDKWRKARNHPKESIKSLSGKGFSTSHICEVVGLSRFSVLHYLEKEGWDEQHKQNMENRKKQEYYAIADKMIKTYENANRFGKKFNIARFCRQNKVQISRGYGIFKNEILKPLSMHKNSL